MGHCRWRLVVLLPFLVCLAATAEICLHAADAPEKKTTGKKTTAKNQRSQPPKQADALKAPANWPANHPLPHVASNCVRCHLTAGRELTQAVVDFAHSVHDLNEMSCNDCHGGNTQDDVRAHEEEFDFIGTKISAHLKQCGECHAEQAEILAAGPHAWDFSKRINTKYPMCVDCHGNHDIGNPPADFKLADVCGDCHRDFEQKFPQLAAVVDQEDRLWKTIIAIGDKKLGTTSQRVPKAFQSQVDQLRHDAMLVMHQAKELSPEASQALVAKFSDLRGKLQNWLNQQN